MDSSHQLVNLHLKMVCHQATVMGSSRTLEILRLGTGFVAYIGRQQCRSSLNGDGHSNNYIQRITVSAEGPSHEECKALCEQTSTCIAISYGATIGAVCMLHPCDASSCPSHTVGGSPYSIYAMMCTTTGMASSKTDTTQMTTTTTTTTVATFEIQSKYDGFCWEHDGSGYTQVASCSRDDNQKWYWHGMSIKPASTDVRLDNEANSNYAKVKPCYGNTPQEWYWDGEFLKSNYDHECLFNERSLGLDKMNVFRCVQSNAYKWSAIHETTTTTTTTTVTTTTTTATHTHTEMSSSSTLTTSISTMSTSMTSRTHIETSSKSTLTTSISTVSTSMTSRTHTEMSSTSTLTTSISTMSTSMTSRTHIETSSKSTLTTSISTVSTSMTSRTHTETSSSSTLTTSISTASAWHATTAVGGGSAPGGSTAPRLRGASDDGVSVGLIVGCTVGGGIAVLAMLAAMLFKLSRPRARHPPSYFKEHNFTGKASNGHVVVVSFAGSRDKDTGTDAGRIYSDVIQKEGLAVAVVYIKDKHISEFWDSWRTVLKSYAVGKKFIVVLTLQNGDIGKTQQGEVAFLERCDGKEQTLNFKNAHLVAMSHEQFNM